MNPRILRLVLAFLAGFVLLSFLPLLPELARQMDLTAIPDQFGDMLLYVALALSTALLAVMWRRRRSTAALKRTASAPRPPRPTAPGTALARAGQRAPARTSAPQRAPLSPLTQKIRSGVKPGERLPVIARRHSLSVDAVRVALDREASSPAARPGSSFRSRQVPASASTPPRPRLRDRNPYASSV